MLDLWTQYVYYLCESCTLLNRTVNLCWILAFNFSTSCKHYYYLDFELPLFYFYLHFPLSWKLDDFVKYGCICCFPIRSGFPSNRRNTSGSTSCHGSLPHPNAFHYAHCPIVHGGHMDCKYPWLHTREIMACYGRRLPYHTPHHLSP